MMTPDTGTSRSPIIATIRQHTGNVVHELKKIATPEGKSILKLFLITRLVLLAVGVVARLVFPDAINLFNPAGSGLPAPLFSDQLWLDIWGCWDSKWYLDIAMYGYSADITSEAVLRINFFPLYPVLARILGHALIGPFVAGLVISNVSLLGSCYFLYKIARLDASKEESLLAVKYVFLFPTAFILNGFFTESLSLLLILMVMYHARTGKWHLVGIAGFFLALTKSLGVFMFIPAGLEYLRQRQYNLKKLDWRCLFLALLPAGLGVYMLYNHYLLGDFLAFAHMQQSAWGFDLAAIGTVLLKSILFMDAGIIAILAIAGFTVLFLKKKLGFVYWVMVLLLIIIPTIGGITASLPRYLLIIFPVYLLQARHIGDRRDVQAALFACQCVLMFTWALRAPVII